MIQRIKLGSQTTRKNEKEERYLKSSRKLNKYI